MKREFIHTEVFDTTWKDLSLDDEALRNLQNELMNSPFIGPVVPGTGGLRKSRFAISGKGKRGGARVIYLDLSSFGVIYLMMAYPKNEKVNLSMAERKELKTIVTNIKKNYRIKLERKR